MRVNERKGVLDPQVGGAGAVRPEGGAEPPGGSPDIDRVSVSQAARDLALLRVGVGDVGAVDQEKVAGLSAVMARGQYSADLRDVARKLLREILGELVS
jgi:anti-sigma28 factor (negative regulator of flagellin synthesis)